MTAIRLFIICLILWGFAITIVLTGLAHGAEAENSPYQEAALDYMESGQWDYASYEWRKALEEDPKNIKAHIGLAKSLAKSGFLKEAIQHLQETRTRSNDSSLDIQLAAFYRQAGEQAAGVAIYEEILKKRPFHVKAYQGLLETRRYFPETQRARLEQLLKKTALQSIVKAQSAVQAGNYSESIPYYEIAVSYFKKDDLHNDYGLALLLSGQSEQAVKQFGVLSKSKAQWSHQANSALVALSLGKTFEAKKHVEKAIALASQNEHKAKLYNILGYIHETSGKPVNAKLSYERAIALDPAFEKAKLNLAYILQQDYQLERAIEIYKDILSEKPENADVWNKLGFIYELMRESKRAENAYMRAIKADPRHEDAHYNLSILYKKMDKQKRADESLRKLADMKFQKIEAGKGAKKVQPSAYKHPLFQYVDVFFERAMG